MTKEILNHLEEQMENTLSFFKDELNGVRAGRANPKILEKVMVDFYGVDTPIEQTGNISVPEARLIQIKPYDVNMIANIEKAINSANLGFNANNDGKVIRIAVPMLTEERRKELVKEVKKMGEDAKIAVRNERRHANDALKKSHKDGEITEDDLERAEKKVQEITDSHVKDIDNVVKKKEEEVLEV
ncbi:MAG: ribosome recycling factor [Clostridiales bacterium]|nr:MAG: ribosome recycling factor [Clostridiales bacterium]